MKTKSPLFRSIGVLVALLVVTALPTTLLAICGYAEDPYCELYYGTGNSLSLEVECENPTGATIFYVSSLDQPIPSNIVPTHTGATPGPNTNYCASGTKLSIPYGHTLYIKMLAWKSCWADSGIVDCEQHNPNQ